MSITVTCKAGLRKGMPKPPLKGSTKPATRIARMLALAYHVEQLVDDGTLRDYAHAAELLGVSRARLSQVLGLLNLAAEIQEKILQGKLAASERQLRQLLSLVDWRDQAASLGVLSP